MDLHCLACGTTIPIEMDSKGPIGIDAEIVPCRSVQCSAAFKVVGEESTRRGEESEVYWRFEHL